MGFFIGVNMALIKTQGTQVYVIDGTSVHEIGEIVNVEPGQDSVNKIDVTPLAEKVAKKYMSGLTDPSESSLSLRFDSNSAAHKKVIELSKSKKEGLTFAIGASDGTSEPTAPSGNATLPNTRSWWKFVGSIGSASFKFESDNVVTCDVSITRSSTVDFQAKS